MKIKDGIFWLDDAINLSPSQDSISYTDIDGNKVVIPYSLLFDLYEIVKFDKEQKGVNFEEFKQKNIRQI